MKMHNCRNSEMRALSRRGVLALLGSGVLTALAPRPSLAVSADFAAFNRRYVSDIIVPHFVKLQAACSNWHDVIQAMVQKPSAGKAALIDHRDDLIWDAWMAAEPFMYRPGRSQMREDGLIAWGDRPEGLVEAVRNTVSLKAAGDITPARVRASILGAHSLAVLDILLEGEGPYRDIVRDFYLAENGARRTALLQAVVASMATEAGAAAESWAAVAAAGALAGSSARMTTAHFLRDQIDLLKTVTSRKMATRAQPGIDFAPRFGVAARLGPSIMHNLETVNDAILSPSGLISLLPEDDVELEIKLQGACSATVDRASGTVAIGYPLPTYSAAFFLSMCCFSPCPPLEEREQKAQARNLENQERIASLTGDIHNLRVLLQSDFADATGLSADLKI